MAQWMFWKGEARNYCCKERLYFAPITVFCVPLQRRILRWSFLSKSIIECQARSASIAATKLFIYTAAHTHTKANTACIHCHHTRCYGRNTHGHSCKARTFAFSLSHTHANLSGSVWHVVPYFYIHISVLHFSSSSHSVPPPPPWPSLFISQSVSHASKHADSALLQGCIYQDDKVLSDNSQVSQG